MAKFELTYKITAPIGSTVQTYFEIEDELLEDYPKNTLEGDMLRRTRATFALANTIDYEFYEVTNEEKLDDSS